MVWRVPDCQGGAAVDGCKVKSQVEWQCRAIAQRAASPRLALHCMRLRVLRVNEDMLLARLTVTARVIYTCYISMSVARKPYLCRREVVLLPETSQNVLHFTHMAYTGLGRAQSVTSPKHKATCNQYRVTFQYQAHLHLKFRERDDYISGCFQVVVTGHCMRGLRSSS